MLTRASDVATSPSPCCSLAMPCRPISTATARRSTSLPRSSRNCMRSASCEPAKENEPWLRPLAIAASAVVDAAAVRRGRCHRDRLAGLQLVQRGGHVVLRGLDVLGIGGALVVDRAVVDQLAGGIDHIHVRRGLRAIRAPDLAGL